MYYTGTDPFSKKTLHVVRNPKDRLMQRAFMKFFRLANWFTVFAPL
jgi:hypothetical protein